MKKEKLRAIMILNEIEVDVARIVKFDPDYNSLKEKIGEVRTILLDEEYPTVTPIIPELDWTKIKEVY
jgi:hypothetical protein